MASILHLERRDSRVPVFDVQDELGERVGVVSAEQAYESSSRARFMAAVVESATPQWRSYGHRTPDAALHALEAHICGTEP